MSKYFPGNQPNDHYERHCPDGKDMGVEHSMFGREDEEIDENIADGGDINDPWTKYYCPTCISLEQGTNIDELMEMGFAEEQARRLMHG